jgi:division protein CdvB (Snf7/Vps24/ESCRT-III family)
LFKKLFKRAPPLKDALDDTIIRLNQQKKKLDILSCKVKSRERVLFESCTIALQKKDSERANIYANELTEVKKVHKTVTNGTLLLEQLILRMETLREVGSTFAQLKPTLEVVKDISGQLSEVMPEVSNELSNIGSVLDDAMISMNIDMSQDMIMKIPDSVMGEEIIEQASNFLRSKIEEELPVPPKEERYARAIVLGGDEEEAEVPIPRIVTNIAKNVGNKEEAVLVYLRTNGGEFDLGECSKCCKVPESEIPDIIEGLSRKGLIKIMTVEGAIAGDGSK